MNRITVITTAAAALIGLAGTATAATALHREVTLTVDGASRPASAFGTTVADVLAASGVALGPRDLVFPSPQSPISDGQTITVEYSKQVTVTVDGAPVTFHTTATDLGAALSEVALDGLADSRLSASRSLALPREGVAVVATTPKEITLVVGGKKKQVTTLSSTVSELLAEHSLTPESDDRLTPATTAAVSEGMTVRLDRVEIASRTLTEKVPHASKTTKDATLWKGESSLKVAGKDGSAKRTYTITTVNGKEEKRTKTAETILTKAVTEVRVEGTKVSANGVGLNLARAAMWDRIARCESTSNWSINTGNGYYGGLQFSRATWNSVGGRDFAAYPHQASRAEQITVANRLYARAGTSPWSCA